MFVELMAFYQYVFFSLSANKLQTCLVTKLRSQFIKLICALCTNKFTILHDISYHIKLRFNHSVNSRIHVFIIAILLYLLYYVRVR
jgi:hypothetical protein